MDVYGWMNEPTFSECDGWVGLPAGPGPAHTVLCLDLTTAKQWNVETKKLTDSLKRLPHQFKYAWKLYGSIGLYVTLDIYNL